MSLSFLSRLQSCVLPLFSPFLSFDSDRSPPISSVPIPREDVATVLLRLSELPKGTADGLALDCTSGDVEIKEALEKAAKRGRTDWVG